jgi:hypothetical protein
MNISIKFPKKLAMALACASSLMSSAAHAQQRIGTVFYILIENRNFTAGTDTTGGSVIVGNAAAPYLNSLITPGNPNAAQVSYCTAYHNVLALPGGTASANSIHPSEPNYVWFEAGSNLSKLDDNDPYGTGASVQQIANYLAANPTVSGQNLSGLVQAAGFTWSAYAEGTNLINAAGANSNLATSGQHLTVAPEPESSWTVPLVSFSGSNASYLNPYNNSTQWNFACKHTGSLFFTDTNGSTVTTANPSTSNPEAPNYHPLADLASDLANNTVSQFNVITPDQFNDMHTALTAGFTYNGTHFTGDLAQVAQGDNFLSIVVPLIMASQAYQNNGMIVIWTDETEGTNQNDFNHTLTEVVISPLAKGNAFASNLNYTHSSDLNTLQKIFQLTGFTPTGFLNDAANPSNSSGGATGVGFGTGTAVDLSDLFQPGVIPAGIPTTQITASGYLVNRRTSMVTQTVTVTNLLDAPLAGPVYLVAGGLSANTSLVNSIGTTQNTAPLGSPYVLVSGSGLQAGAAATVTLQFSPPTSGSISDSLIVVSGQP